MGFAVDDIVHIIEIDKNKKEVISKNLYRVDEILGVFGQYYEIIGRDGVRMIRMANALCLNEMETMLRKLL